jgi:hypothetical protein
VRRRPGQLIDTNVIRRDVGTVHVLAYIILLQHNAYALTAAKPVYPLLHVLLRARDARYSGGDSVLAPRRAR